MKFSIRDLFLVTAVVALVLGWWVDHWRMANRLSDVEESEYLGRRDTAIARREARQLREHLRANNVPLPEPPKYLPHTLSPVPSPPKQ